ncbi:MAG: Dna2/Cas4 domain-containing protein [Acidobacteria bacterium]|nr:Dna2/Cas4 domain-containing protein [Acidobacteriota bacterium]
MSLYPPDSPEQIPARMLNEFAYCPRLFYLEYVQQEWDHSADTLSGRLVHRRVDDQGGAVPAADELDDQVRIHARSIAIGSDSLGAIAKIDLLTGEDGWVRRSITSAARAGQSGALLGARARAVMLARFALARKRLQL